MTDDLGPAFTVRTAIVPVLAHVVELDGVNMTVPCEPWQAYMVTVKLDGTMTSSRLFTTEHEARRAQSELFSILNSQPGAIPRIGLVPPADPPVA